MKNLTYAFRYLLKARGNNVIRVLSLTLGLAFGLLLFAYINYTLTFDRFFPDKERIFKMYGVSTSDSENKLQQTVMAPLAPTMMDEIPQVEAASHIYGVMEYDYMYNNETFAMRMLAIDSMFFDVLDYGVISGDPKDVYRNENYVMLSESQAKIMFGSENPIGKVIISSMNNERIVCGIFKDPPLNNHLDRFNMLSSFREVERNFKTTWDGNRDFLTYVKLRQNTNIADVEAQIPALIEKHGASELIKQYGLSFIFKPITQAHSSEGTRMQYIYLFSLLALLLLMVSAVNYVLLSISGFVRRAKTIAMLRCNGARRFDVAKIFLSETAIILSIAVIFSIIIIWGFQNAITQLCSTPVGELFSFSNIWVSIVVIIALFLFASISPAMLFASTPLTAAFRGITEGRRRWKHILLFFQLGGVTFVIVFLGISVMQFNRLSKGDQGYAHDKLLYVSLMGNYNTFINYETELSTLPQVEAVGTSYCLPAYGYGNKSIFDENSNVLFSACTDATTPTYFDAMDIHFAEGQAFTQESPVNDVVVNEEFVRLQGWNGSALNREIIEGTDQSRTRYRIVGVIKNIRIRADQGKILPLVFHNIRENMPVEDLFYGGCRTMVRLNEINPANIAAVKAKIEEWYSTDNHHVTVYSQIYNQVMIGERSFRNVLVISSIITLLIAFIGLWGYLNDETNRRNKEIAIRRINGAKVEEILLLLAKGLSTICIPAILVGLATCYFVSQRWLQQFNNKIELSAWIFLLGALIMMIVVYTIQIVRTWRAANANPVDNLKSE